MVVVRDRDIIISLSPHQITSKCQIKRVTTTSHLRTTANKAVVMIPVPVIVVLVAAATVAAAADHGTTEEAIPTEMEAPARTATTKDPEDTRAAAVVEEAAAVGPVATT